MFPSQRDRKNQRKRPQRNFYNVQSYSWWDEFRNHATWLKNLLSSVIMKRITQSYNALHVVVEIKTFFYSVQCWKCCNKNANISFFLRFNIKAVLNEISLSVLQQYLNYTKMIFTEMRNKLNVFVDLTLNSLNESILFFGRDLIKSLYGRTLKHSLEKNLH